jgi:hypothetical protein
LQWQDGERKRGWWGEGALISNKPSTDAPRWLTPIAPKQADGTATWATDASWSKDEIGPFTCKGRKCRGDGGAQSWLNIHSSSRSPDTGPKPEEHQKQRATHRLNSSLTLRPLGSYSQISATHLLSASLQKWPPQATGLSKGSPANARPQAMISTTRKRQGCSSSAP